MSLEELPQNLPVPHDDGAADHLTGLALPALELVATQGDAIALDKQPGLLLSLIHI